MIIPDPKNSPGAFWQMARAMATWCARAYDYCLVTDPHTGAAAHVTLDDDGDVIVAFRGSQSVQDWMQDLEAWRVPLAFEPGQALAVEVHHGFLEDFDSIDQRVIEAVKGMLLASPTAKIFVTGHSLGGGQASLCALEFARLKLPLGGVFTFGQPRVGNRAYAQLYNSTPSANPNFTLKDFTWRIVNAGDPVPLLPTLLMGYRDEANEIFLPANGGPQINPWIGLQAAGDALGIFAAWRQHELALLGNHHLAAYQERMTNL
ncbi:MAG: lipase family protein [Patescibacteria group bacterium]|nr:lipase family protein [Patescibacteria group bacterium]